MSILTRQSLSRPILLQGLALALIIVETCCTLQWPTDKIPTWSTALGLALSGLALGFLFGVPLRAHPAPEGILVQRPRWMRWIPMLLLLLGCVWLLRESRHLFWEMPLDKQASDVIPSIVVMVKRVLAGTYPYVPILDFGYHLEATYLPMQWLPYIPAQLGGFDYRYTAFAIWVMGAVVVVWRASDRLFTGLLVAALLLWQYQSVIQYSDGTIKMTVESMVAAYYMLLVAAIGRGKGLWIGLAVGVCLLSRYSLVLWLPLAALVWWRGAGGRKFWTAVGVALCVVLALYVLPFLTQDPASFYRGYKYYDVSALGEWENQGTPGMPYQLYNGHGFAHVFYERLAHLPLPARLHALQRTHLIVCLGAVALMGAYYLWRKPKVHRFLLASFKIYLTLFLAFIQVPYTYLMVVGLFVSTAIFSEWRKSGEERVRPLA